MRHVGYMTYIPVFQRRTFKVCAPIEHAVHLSTSREFVLPCTQVLVKLRSPREHIGHTFRFGNIPSRQIAIKEGTRHEHRREVFYVAHIPILQVGSQLFTLPKCTRQRFHCCQRRYSSGSGDIYIPTAFKCVR